MRVIDEREREKINEEREWRFVSLSVCALCVCVDFLSRCLLLDVNACVDCVLAWFEDVS